MVIVVVVVVVMVVMVQLYNSEWWDAEELIVEGTDV